MNKSDAVMTLVSPLAVLKQIARAIPPDCRKNIIVIGSLAAGYHFFGNDPKLQVRTKGADCLLSPRIKAIPAGIKVTERLFQEKWRFRPDEKWSKPGDATVPDNELPAVRLNPPGSSNWFIELLTVPESPTDRKQHWSRLVTSAGHFGLCSFGFLSLANYRPISTPFGIAIARPELMALANLLEHPKIGGEKMSGLIAGRAIKRSNKDLGRVLAIARLSIGQDEDALLEWPDTWAEALQDRFPSECKNLAQHIGDGLRTLIANPNDLDEAHHTCLNGLLATNRVTVEQLRLAGERLLNDAIVPLGERYRA